MITNGDNMSELCELKKFEFSIAGIAGQEGTLFIYAHRFLLTPVWVYFYIDTEVILTIGSKHLLFLREIK